MMALELAVLVAGGDDARAFLPAMLQSVESKKSDLRRARMAKDGEDPALILWTVLENGARRRGMVHAHASYTPSVAKEKRFRLFNDFFVTDAEGNLLIVADDQEVVPP
jgi:hypothetical protein